MACMIAADHSQCQIQNDKLLLTYVTSGWLDGWLVHTTHRISESQGDDALFLPACLPACVHASIYKEEELIIRLINVHTTRIIMHQHLKMILGILTVVVVVPADLTYSLH